MNGCCAVYGLYYRRHRQVGDVERLLATDCSKQALRDRWNSKQKQACIKYGVNNKRYHDRIDDPRIGAVFVEGDILNYCIRRPGVVVGITVSIREIKQWDR